MPDTPQFNLLQALLQAYQGQADTAGPYYNLASIFQQGYGQLGLTNQQQQMFGYDVGPGGGIGSPSTPPGGFFGGGASAAAPVYGPTQGPTQGPAPAGSPYGPPSLATGGAGYNFPVAGTDPGTSGASAPSFPLYSPPDGTKIGLGNTFMDPYAGVTGPGQAPGHHPGTLDLNTTALSAFGPLATGALLQSNPYLAGGLDLQTLAAANAATPSGILNTLNTQAQQGLDSGGQLSEQEKRALSQQTLAGFAAGGMNNGNQSLGADLLSRDNAVRSRMQQAQSLASGVQGLNFTQQGLAGSLAQGLSNSATSGITNPLMQILGLGSLNSTSSPSTSINDQAQMTNPFMQAGLDAASANFNAQSAANIAQSNNDAATNAGWLTLGGSFLKAFSDRRLKTEIKATGKKTRDGIPIKTWRYKTDPKRRTYKGVMAQDAEKINPYSVMTDPVSGVKAVDYSKLGISMEMRNPYRKAA